MDPSRIYHGWYPAGGSEEAVCLEIGWKKEEYERESKKETIKLENRNLHKHLFATKRGSKNAAAQLVRREFRVGSN